MRLYRLLFAILALCTLSAPLAAQRGGRVRVRGYTRHDGTYVAPHTRAAPHSRSYTAPAPRPRSYSAPRAYRAPSARSRAYVAPDSRSRPHRSRSARDDFMRRTGYPRGDVATSWTTSCHSAPAAPTRRPTCNGKRLKKER